MTKTMVQTEKCPYCKHFDFCLIPWGAECKRQGGKKIPKMKSLSLALRPKANKKSEKPNNKIINRHDSIRTKKVNWG